MNLIDFIVLFVGFTLLAHSALAWSVAGELSRLGFNRTKWVLLILVGGIPALLFFRTMRARSGCAASGQVVEPAPQPSPDE